MSLPLGWRSRRLRVVYSSSTGASVTMFLRLQTYVPLARTWISKRLAPGNTGLRKLRTRLCQVLLSPVISDNLKKIRRATELSPRSRPLAFRGRALLVMRSPVLARLPAPGPRCSLRRFAQPKRRFRYRNLGLCIRIGRCNWQSLRSGRTVRAGHSATAALQPGGSRLAPPSLHHRDWA